MLYILKFERKIAGRAQYYIGWTKDEYTYISRMKQHRKGTGAALTRAALAAGIPWRTVVIVPEADRREERRYKNWKNAGDVVKALLNKGYGASL